MSIGRKLWWLVRSTFRSRMESANEYNKRMVRELADSPITGRAIFQYMAMSPKGHAHSHQLKDIAAALDLPGSEVMRGAQALAMRNWITVEPGNTFEDEAFKFRGMHSSNDNDPIYFTISPRGKEEFAKELELQVKVLQASDVQKAITRGVISMVIAGISAGIALVACIYNITKADPVVPEVQKVQLMPSSRLETHSDAIQSIRLYRDSTLHDTIDVRIVQPAPTTTK